MNINKFIAILFFIIPMGLGYKLPAGDIKDTENLSSKNPVKEYKQALELITQTSQANQTNKEACEKLEKIFKDSTFTLHELASIRFNQYCVKNPQWENLKIKNETLIPFLHQARFEREMEKKNFREAYRVFNKNRNWIPVDTKEFEKMASEALKTNLSTEEKKELLFELQSKSPRFIPLPKEEDFIKVARDYRKNRKFKKALFYYRKVTNDPKMDDNQRWKAFKGIRLTYRLERWTKTKEYIKASKQWANFLGKKYLLSKKFTRLHHKANIEYIRTLWTEKGQGSAKPVLEQLEKELKHHYSLQAVYWLKGRMAEEKKQYEEAVSWLKKSFLEKSLSDNHKEKVLWSLAWNQRRLKKFKESMGNMKLLKKNPNITLFAKSQYLYWRAENLESMGKQSKAKKVLRDLADLDLYGYYGALAHRKLQIPFPTSPQPQWDEKKLLNFFKKKDQIFFLALIESGEGEIARSMISKKIKTNKKWKILKWAHYLALLQKSGAYSKSFELYHRLSAKKQRTILEKYPFLLFPQPYKNIVINSAEKTKTSPALIYSIMKQESGFNTKARSPADAFGLLQLIPQVAQKMSQITPSIEYKTSKDLYKPAVVIPLGAEKLKELFSKFDGHFIPAVASYNSTEKVVLNWIQSRFQEDPVTFIEEIPYRETKNYVRLVMRNYIAYNRFDPEEKIFYFPEVCLQGLEKFKKSTVSK